MQANGAKVRSILKNSAKTAEAIDLVYVNETKLTIKRHRHGRGFFYTQNKLKIKDKKEIKRFKGLVIPPAWNNVIISPLKNSHLQVIGRDSKRRKQYRYHPHWSQIRNKTKFLKMAAFGNVLPEIRKQVELDLKIPRMSKRKCLALVVKLMEETHIRIGNEYYAQKNKSYGLSTLRTKHLEIHNTDFKFHFIGKKGKEHAIKIRNKRLQRLVLQCKDIPGWELFQYYDEEGNHHSIDSGMVNDYIHEISGDLFSAKDFRTWAASKIFFEALSTLDVPETKSEINSNINYAFDQAAKGLGNTRNVCKKYYVHPALIEKYESGALYPIFEKLDNMETNETLLSNSEKILLDILSKYKIEFKSES